MKNRILLKEIPSSKFHSAVFTTYSINLYYLEQQVLPLLGSKGIHYVSVLADSQMLSSQLDAYSLLSEQRKRSYAINGIKCSGAFHPKIIFLAGETSLLLLIGSGNLTTSGHGKNLEVWNAIYVDNKEDKKLGLIYQAWSYIKGLHSDLGISAQNKLKSIEENCSLFSNIEKINLLDAYQINNNEWISFFSPKEGNSLFRQLAKIIGSNKIEKITIMSPYYDSEGKFIELLNKHFKPDSINIILQDEFGVVPDKMKPSNNVHFYNWRDVRNESFRQEYFHAKNLIFEGKNQKYLLSGSANASTAAFGSEQFSSLNQEACILFQNNTANYLDVLGLSFKAKKSDLSAFENSASSLERTSELKKQIFIKNIEKSYDNITLYLSSEKPFPAVSIKVFDSKGKVQFEKEIAVPKGESNLQFPVSSGLSLMFSEAFVGEQSASNKQFVIDINAFENTNPSPKNRSLNQIRKIIETNGFSTQKIIDYLNTIYKQKEVKKIANPTGAMENGDRKNELQEEEESDLLYLSYEEVLKKAKNIAEIKNAKGYIEYKSVRLWESIFSYLKESKQSEEQAKIDEEETEDINSSTGRIEIDKNKDRKPISKSNYQRMKDKVDKFLHNYWEILLSKTNNKDADAPSLIDLSMFLIVLEILLHLSSHKEIIEEDQSEKYLLQIPFTDKDHSWSEYTIHFIGIFLLWSQQKGGFKEINSEEYKLKLASYKKMAFKTSVSALSLFGAINKRYDQSKIIAWRNLGLLNVNLVFNPEKVNYSNLEEFEEFVPKQAREEIGEVNFSEELLSSLSFIGKSPLKKLDFVVNDYYSHPNDGYTLIRKVIGNSNNSFFKLYSTGYEWDEDLLDYWNGKVYSHHENKWFNSRKESL